MVREDRDASFVRPNPAQDGGESLFGLLPYTHCVPVPDPVSGKLGEIGEEVAEEVAPGVDHRRHRELVENQ